MELEAPSLAARRNVFVVGVLVVVAVPAVPVEERVALRADGAAVGTDIMDLVGVASKHKELTIHRVILRR